MSTTEQATRKCAALFALYLFILWPMESGIAIGATPDEAPPDDPFAVIQDKLAHGGTITPEDIDRLNDA